MLTSGKAQKGTTNQSNNQEVSKHDSHAIFDNETLKKRIHRLKKATGQHMSVPTVRKVKKRSNDHVNNNYNERTNRQNKASDTTGGVDRSAKDGVNKMVFVNNDTVELRNRLQTSLHRKQLLSTLAYAEQEKKNADKGYRISSNGLLVSTKTDVYQKWDLSNPDTDNINKVRKICSDAFVDEDISRTSYEDSVDGDNDVDDEEKSDDDDEKRSDNDDEEEESSNDDTDKSRSSPSNKNDKSRCVSSNENEKSRSIPSNENDLIRSTPSNENDNSRSNTPNENVDTDCQNASLKKESDLNMSTRGDCWNIKQYEEEVLVSKEFTRVHAVVQVKTADKNLLFQDVDMECYDHCLRRQPDRGSRDYVYTYKETQEPCEQQEGMRKNQKQSHVQQGTDVIGNQKQLQWQQGNNMKDNQTERHFQQQSRLKEDKKERHTQENINHESKCVQEKRDIVTESQKDIYFTEKQIGVTKSFKGKVGPQSQAGVNESEKERQIHKQQKSASEIQTKNSLQIGECDLNECVLGTREQEAEQVVTENRHRQHLQTQKGVKDNGDLVLANGNRENVKESAEAGLTQQENVERITREILIQGQWKREEEYIDGKMVAEKKDNVNVDFEIVLEQQHKGKVDNIKWMQAEKHKKSDKANLEDGKYLERMLEEDQQEDIEDLDRRLEEKQRVGEQDPEWRLEEERHEDGEDLEGRLRGEQQDGEDLEGRLRGEQQDGEDLEGRLRGEQQEKEDLEDKIGEDQQEDVQERINEGQQGDEEDLEERINEYQQKDEDLEKRIDEDQQKDEKDLEERIDEDQAEDLEWRIYEYQLEDEEDLEKRNNEEQQEDLEDQKGSAAETQQEDVEDPEERIEEVVKYLDGRLETNQQEQVRDLRTKLEEDQEDYKDLEQNLEDEQRKELDNLGLRLSGNQHEVGGGLEMRLEEAQQEDNLQGRLEDQQYDWEDPERRLTDKQQEDQKESYEVGLGQPEGDETIRKLFYVQGEQTHKCENGVESTKTTPTHTFFSKKNQKDSESNCQTKTNLASELMSFGNDTVNDITNTSSGYRKFQELHDSLITSLANQSDDFFEVDNEVTSAENNDKNSEYESNYVNSEGVRVDCLNAGERELNKQFKDKTITYKDVTPGSDDAERRNKQVSYQGVISASQLTNLSNDLTTKCGTNENKCFDRAKNTSKREYESRSPDMTFCTANVCGDGVAQTNRGHSEDHHIYSNVDDSKNANIGVSKQAIATYNEKKGRIDITEEYTVRKELKVQDGKTARVFPNGTDPCEARKCSIACAIEDNDFHCSKNVTLDASKQLVDSEHELVVTPENNIQLVEKGKINLAKTILTYGERETGQGSSEINTDQSNNDVQAYGFLPSQIINIHDIVTGTYLSSDIPVDVTGNGNEDSPCLKNNASARSSSELLNGSRHRSDQISVEQLYDIAKNDFFSKNNSRNIEPLCPIRKDMSESMQRSQHIHDTAQTDDYSRSNARNNADASVSIHRIDAQCISSPHYVTASGSAFGNGDLEEVCTLQTSQVSPSGPIIVTCSRDQSEHVHNSRQMSTSLSHMSDLTDITDTTPTQSSTSPSVHDKTIEVDKKHRNRVVSVSNHNGRKNCIADEEEGLKEDTMIHSESVHVFHKITNTRLHSRTSSNLDMLETREHINANIVHKFCTNERNETSSVYSDNNSFAAHYRDNEEHIENKVESDVYETCTDCRVAGKTAAERYVELGNSCSKSHTEQSQGTSEDTSNLFCCRTSGKYSRLCLDEQSQRMEETDNTEDGTIISKTMKQRYGCEEKTALPFSLHQDKRQNINAISAVSDSRAEPVFVITDYGEEESWRELPNEGEKEIDILDSYHSSDIKSYRNGFPIETESINSEICINNADVLQQRLSRWDRNDVTDEAVHRHGNKESVCTSGNNILSIHRKTCKTMMGNVLGRAAINKQQKGKSSQNTEKYEECPLSCMVTGSKITVTKKEAQVKYKHGLSTCGAINKRRATRTQSKPPGGDNSSTTTLSPNILPARLINPSHKPSRSNKPWAHNRCSKMASTNDDAVSERRDLQKVAKSTNHKGEPPRNQHELYNSKPTQNYTRSISHEVTPLRVVKRDLKLSSSQSITNQKHEPHSEPQSELKQSQKHEPHSEPQSELKQSQKHEPHSEPQSELKQSQKHEPHSEPQSELKQSQKHEPHSEPQSELKQSQKHEPQSELKQSQKHQTNVISKTKRIQENINSNYSEVHDNSPHANIRKSHTSEHASAAQHHCTSGAPTDHFPVLNKCCDDLIFPEQQPVSISRADLNKSIHTSSCEEMLIIITEDSRDSLKLSSTTQHASPEHVAGQNVMCPAICPSSRSEEHSCGTYMTFARVVEDNRAHNSINYSRSSSCPLLEEQSMHNNLDMMETCRNEGRETAQILNIETTDRPDTSQHSFPSPEPSVILSPLKDGPGSLVSENVMASDDEKIHINSGYLRNVADVSICISPAIDVHAFFDNEFRQACEHDNTFDRKINVFSENEDGIFEETSSTNKKLDRVIKSDETHQDENIYRAVNNKSTHIHDGPLTTSRNLKSTEVAASSGELNKDTPSYDGHIINSHENGVKQHDNVSGIIFVNKTPKSDGVTFRSMISNFLRQYDDDVTRDDSDEDPSSVTKTDRGNREAVVLVTPTEGYVSNQTDMCLEMTPSSIYHNNRSMCIGLNCHKECVDDEDVTNDHPQKFTKYIPATETPRASELTYAELKIRALAKACPVLRNIKAQARKSMMDSASVASVNKTVVENSRSLQQNSHTISIINNSGDKLEALGKNKRDQISGGHIRRLFSVTDETYTMCQESLNNQDYENVNNSKSEEDIDSSNVNTATCQNSCSDNSTCFGIDKINSWVASHSDTLLVEDGNVPPQCCQGSKLGHDPHASQRKCRIPVKKTVERMKRTLSKEVEIQQGSKNQTDRLHKQPTNLVMVLKSRNGIKGEVVAALSLLKRTRTISSTAVDAKNIFELPKNVGVYTKDNKVTVEVRVDSSSTTDSATNPLDPVRLPLVERIKKYQQERPRNIFAGRSVKREDNSRAQASKKSKIKPDNTSSGSDLSIIVSNTHVQSCKDDTNAVVSSCATNTSPAENAAASKLPKLNRLQKSFGEVSVMDEERLEIHEDNMIPDSVAIQTSDNTSASAFAWAVNRGALPTKDTSQQTSLLSGPENEHGDDERNICAAVTSTKSNKDENSRDQLNNLRTCKNERVSSSLDKTKSCLPNLPKQSLNLKPSSGSQLSNSGLDRRKSQREYSDIFLRKNTAPASCRGLNPTNEKAIKNSTTNIQKQHRYKRLERPSHIDQYKQTNGWKLMPQCELLSPSASEHGDGSLSKVNTYLSLQKQNISCSKVENIQEESEEVLENIASSPNGDFRASDCNNQYQKTLIEPTISGSVETNTDVFCVEFKNDKGTKIPLNRELRLQMQDNHLKTDSTYTIESRLEDSEVILFNETDNSVETHQQMMMNPVLDASGSPHSDSSHTSIPKYLHLIHKKTRNRKMVTGSSEKSHYVGNEKPIPLMKDNDEKISPERVLASALVSSKLNIEEHEQLSPVCALSTNSADIEESDKLIIEKLTKDLSNAQNSQIEEILVQALCNEQEVPIEQKISQASSKEQKMKHVQKSKQVLSYAQDIQKKQDMKQNSSNVQPHNSKSSNRTTFNKHKENYGLNPIPASLSPGTSKKRSKIKRMLSERLSFTSIESTLKSNILSNECSFENIPAADSISPSYQKAGTSRNHFRDMNLTYQKSSPNDKELRTRQFRINGKISPAETDRRQSTPASERDGNKLIDHSHTDCAGSSEETTYRKNEVSRLSHSHCYVSSHTHSQAVIHFPVTTASNCEQKVTDTNQLVPYKNGLHNITSSRLNSDESITEQAGWKLQNSKAPFQKQSGMNNPRKGRLTLTNMELNDFERSSPFTHNLLESLSFTSTCKGKSPANSSREHLRAVDSQCLSEAERDQKSSVSTPSIQNINLSASNVLDESVKANLPPLSSRQSGLPHRPSYKRYY